MAHRCLSRRILHQIKALSTLNYCTAKETQVTVNGQTINYLKTGTGIHHVLCMPGALGTIWSDFKPQIMDLDKSSFTIIAWDPPGYGGSRPPERRHNIHFYEDDAQMATNFMEKLGVRRYSILGWSDGGITGMIIAARNPSLIHKLVIWGANSYVIPQELDAYEKIRDVTHWSDRMKRPLIDLYGEEGLQKMWSQWCDALQEIYKQREGDICKTFVDKIQCPTFILHGAMDPLVSDEHVVYLENHIKNSKVYRFSGGKHNIHLRFPGEFNAMVSRFLLDKY